MMRLIDRALMLVTLPFLPLVACLHWSVGESWIESMAYLWDAWKQGWRT